MARGFDVEIDVWYIENQLFLGHDNPDFNESVDIERLISEYLWVHAKSIETLYYLISKPVHVFFHQEDNVTLTSRNILWTYPGRKLTPRSVCITHVEEVLDDYRQCYGLCSDYIEFFRKNL